MRTERKVMGNEELTERLITLEELVRRLMMTLGSGLGSNELRALWNEYVEISNQITKEYATQT